MKARMEKYDTAPEVKQRTKRNERLYSEVQSMNIDYVNIDVNNAVDLSISNGSKSSREDFQKQRELDKILPRKQEISKQTKQEVIPKEDKIIVKGVNIRKKHVKARRQGDESGIIPVECAIPSSKVNVVCSKCGKATKVGYSMEKDQKVRICKKCGAKLK